MGKTHRETDRESARERACVRNQTFDAREEVQRCGMVCPVEVIFLLNSYVTLLVCIA